MQPAAGAPALGPHEAHPFQEPASGDAPERCALCGGRRSQILHHPTRIRAACLLRGLDPDAVLRGYGHEPGA